MLCWNVGGSFGMKASIYPEYVCIAHAARALARPVKWVDERSGSFVSDHHGRDHEMTAELAAIPARHRLVTIEKAGHELGAAAAAVILREAECFANA